MSGLPIRARTISYRQRAMCLGNAGQLQRRRTDNDGERVLPLDDVCMGTPASSSEGVRLQAPKDLVKVDPGLLKLRSTRPKCLERKTWQLPSRTSASRPFYRFDYNCATEQVALHQIKHGFNTKLASYWASRAV